MKKLIAIVFLLIGASAFLYFRNSAKADLMRFCDLPEALNLANEIDLAKRAEKTSYLISKIKHSQNIDLILNMANFIDAKERRNVLKDHFQQIGITEKELKACIGLQNIFGLNLPID